MAIRDQDFEEIPNEDLAADGEDLANPTIAFLEVAGAISIPDHPTVSAVRKVHHTVETAWAYVEQGEVHFNVIPGHREIKEARRKSRVNLKALVRVTIHS